MNTNLKILDKYDQDRNIYDLVTLLAERAHVVVNGNPILAARAGISIPRFVMEELMAGGEEALQRPAVVEDQPLPEPREPRPVEPEKKEPSDE